MNCLDFRRIRLSDPYATDSELLKHRSDCAACRAFEGEIRSLDRKIAKAFTVEVPEGLAARILLNHSLKSRSRLPTRLQWLAMAASVVLAIGVAVYWVAGRERPEQKLVQHLQMEQRGIDSILMPIHEPQLRQVLNSVNLDIVKSIGEVQFASTCVIDGRLVAHLVIKDARNRYTLLLAPTSLGPLNLEFDRDEWHGVIAASVAGGSVAVLARDDSGTDFDTMRELIRRVNQSIAPMHA